MREMTLEQKMTLKAILENRDYKIERIDFHSYRIESDTIAILVDDKTAKIQPDGKITMTQQIEIEL